MIKKELHLVNASYLYPLREKLNQSGLPDKYLYSKNQIKYFDIDNVNTYIPLQVLYQYLQGLTQNLGVQSLAGRFLNHFELDELGEYGQFLSNCPDLLTVISEGVKYDHTFQTNSRMFLEIHGTTSRFYHYHVDEDSNGKFISEDITFTMIINAFRKVLGPDWNPLSLELTPNSSKSILTIVPDIRGPIHFNSRVQSITFETQKLVELNSCATNILQSPFIDLFSYTDKVKALLNSFTPGHLPTLGFISNLLNISERTIVRNLNLELTSFSKLLNEHLFRRALQLLQNENISIREISQFFGYANPANFVRAFKSWTNITPRAYREQSI